MPEQNTRQETPLAAIRAQLADLSPGKQRVASFLLDHSEKALFMTASQIAETASVDTATVVRTAQALGFEGFPELQASLREDFFLNGSPLRIMRTSVDPSDDMVTWSQQVISQDLENIQMLRKNGDFIRIEALVERLFSASRILIVGLDFAAALTVYLGYSLEILRLPVSQSMVGGGRLRNQLSALKPDSVVIGISFKRCLRETVNAIRVSREKGCYTCSITDGFASPLAQFSDCFFLTPINSPSFTSSYVAPVTLINCIVLACSQFDEQRTVECLEQLEDEYLQTDRWY